MLDGEQSLALPVKEIDLRMLDGAAHVRQSFAWGTIFATPASVSGFPTVLAIPHACRVDPDTWAVIE
jgi:hypothetical protein